MKLTAAIAIYYDLKSGKIKTQLFSKIQCDENTMTTIIKASTTGVYIEKNLKTA